MSEAVRRGQVLVIDDHVIRLDVEDEDAPHRLLVTAYVDDRRIRSWEEPGWRNIGFGADAGLPYWWSARRFVALPTATGVSDMSLEVDVGEDILLAFGQLGRWLLVCETSVRLIDGVGGQELARLEFGEVIVEARLTETRLTVVDLNGSVRVIDMDDRGLTLVT